MDVEQLASTWIATCLSEELRPSYFHKGCVLHQWSIFHVLLILTRTPSLGKKIQHDCLMCLGSARPSCDLGHNFKKYIGPQHNFFDQSINKVLNFMSYPNIIGLNLGHETIFLSGSWGICVILGHENQVPIRQLITWSVWGPFLTPYLGQRWPDVKNLILTLLTSANVHTTSV